MNDRTRLLVVVVDLARTAMSALGFLLLAIGFGPDIFADYTGIAALLAVVLPFATLGQNWWVQPLTRQAGLPVSSGASFLVLVIAAGASICILSTISFFTDWAASALISLALVEVVVFPVWSFFSLALMADGRFKSYAIVAILNPLTKLTCVVVFVLVLRVDIVVWALGTSLFGLLIYILTMLLIVRFNLGESLLALRMWFRRGVSFSAVGGLSALTDNSDKLVAAAVLPGSIFADFGLASRLASYASLPLRSIATLAYPTYFDLAERDPNHLRPFMYKTIMRSLPFAVASLAILNLGAFLLSETILEEYSGLSAIVAIFSLGTLFRPIQYAAGDLMYAYGRPYMRLVLTAVGAFLTGFLVLVGTFSLGATGAAVGALISVVILSAVYLVVAEQLLRKTP